MEETISQLKKYVYPNGTYSNIRANSRLIKKHFPNIYEQIKDDYKTKLYMLVQDIKEIPKCKNINCNNKVKLENIGAGFRQFCCNKCIAEFQKTNKEFAKKISITNSINGSIHLKEKYKDLDIRYDKSNKSFIIIKDYCKHGDIRVNCTTFTKLYKQHKHLCIQCNEETLLTIPTENEMNDFYNVFEEFYKKNSLAFNIKWFILNYPKEYNIILYWSKELKNISLSERIYLFKNKLKNRPNCKNPNCHNLVKYSPSQLKYNNFCSSYACTKNISAEQINLYNFIFKYNQSAKMNYFINKSNYDIVINNPNMLFEYNGLYWHSNKVQKDKRYHYKKYLLAKEAGFALFTIWEDEWLNKRPIVESMISNKLGINAHKIGARSCQIKEITSKENHDFCNINHIQGKVSASIRYGLFYKDELVSIMTFGKRRFVKNAQVDEYELLRFCSKLNTNVVGGASKLFKHFIKENKPNIVLSYANCDTSDGNVYKVLGFKNGGHTGINYWWTKGGEKFYRSQFMKYKLVKNGFDISKDEDQIMEEQGFAKVYGTGNIKYVWEKKDI